MSRLGVYGGSFDPPHLAHVALAKAAIQQLNLDEIRIIPTGMTTYKTRTLSAAQHRLDMVRLAFSQVSGVHIDERELKRLGPSYTIDTVRELRQECSASQLFLILGEDQWATFTQWQSWQEIAGNTTIYVAQRETDKASEKLFNEKIPVVPEFKRLIVPLMNVSSTDIRQRVINGLSIEASVGVGVAGYISQHRLYLS